MSDQFTRPFKLCPGVEFFIGNRGSLSKTEPSSILAHRKCTLELRVAASETLRLLVALSVPQLVPLSDRASCHVFRASVGNPPGNRRGSRARQASLRRLPGPNQASSVWRVRTRSRWAEVAWPGVKEPSSSWARPLVAPWVHGTYAQCMARFCSSSDNSSRCGHRRRPAGRRSHSGRWRGSPSEPPWLCGNIEVSRPANRVGA